MIATETLLQELQQRYNAATTEQHRRDLAAQIDAARSMLRAQRTGSVPSPKFTWDPGDICHVDEFGTFH